MPAATRIRLERCARVSKLIDALKEAEAKRRKNLAAEAPGADASRVDHEAAFWEASAAEENERNLLIAANKHAAVEVEGGPYFVVAGVALTVAPRAWSARA